MKSNIFAGLAVMSLLGLGACATSEDIVPVPYAVSTATATPGAQNIRVTVASSDARTENRARLGVQINGYGMEMAAIRSQVEVTDIVRDAISAEQTPPLDCTSSSRAASARSAMRCCSRAR